MASDTLHEQNLPAETLDLHRAIVSLMEELEAIDWYQQRVDATEKEDLKAVLGHNRDEEIEHAMMNLEWIRRNQPTFDTHARTYLFTEGPITEVEKKAKAGGEGDNEGGESEEKPAAASPKARSTPSSSSSSSTSKRSDGSLGIGSLKID